MCRPIENASTTGVAETDPLEAQLWLRATVLREQLDIPSALGIPSMRCACFLLFVLFYDPVETAVAKRGCLLV